MSVSLLDSERGVRRAWRFFSRRVMSIAARSGNAACAVQKYPPLSAVLQIHGRSSDIEIKIAIKFGAIRCHADPLLTQ